MNVFSAIKDFWETLRKTKTKIPENSEEGNFEEIQERERRNQDYKPSKITRPRVYGIKKKFVLLIMAGLATLYLISFMFGSIKNSDTDKSTLVTTGEPETSRPGSGNKFNYNAMMDAQPQSQDNKKVNPLPENKENTPSNQNVNPQYQVPPINYNEGYAAPSSGYYAPQFIDPTKVESQNNPNEDYRKSPIGFNIGFNAATNNNTGNAAEGASEAQSQITGQASVQPNIKNVATSKISYVQPELYTLQQGAIIPVTLLTGINSDLPGQIIAQVRENVYDSVSGNYLLIPQGAKLIGGVKGDAPKTGQERIGVSWQRLIFPNGISVDLGDMDGIDTAGYAGLKDKVDNHTGKIIGATLFSSLLAAGAQIAAGNTGDTSTQSASQMAVSGSATSMMNAGTEMIKKNININPTIKIRPGIHFAVFVNRDVVLKPYR